MLAVQIAAARPVGLARSQRQATATPALTVTRSAVRPRVVVRAEPMTQEAKSAVETAIEQAKETCDSGTTQECAAAWDEVEELAANASHRKDAAKSDPLEEYCDDNPEADECRVYED